MLKFEFDIELNKPLETVLRLWSDRSSYPKWQPGLITDEIIYNADQKKKFRLTYLAGKRKLVLTETILRDELPQCYEVVFETKGVRNLVRNTFTSEGPDKTRWQSHVEFRFSGLMKLISGFMKKGFEQQSKMIMDNFKSFVEKQK